MDIKGKVVLITGASAGIGMTTARRFAEAGATLALVARSTDQLKKLRDELRGLGVDASYITTDLRDPDQVRRAVLETARYFGRINILINNAGQAAAGRVENVSIYNYRQIIDLNIMAPLIAMQTVIPIMREQGGGIIINISSMVTKMHIPGLAAYASTKSALNMLSDTARAELAPDNIRVISVFPRYTTTDFHTNALGAREPQPEAKANASFPVDPPELVAEKILAAAINEPEEQYMDR